MNSVGAIAGGSSRSVTADPVSERDEGMLADGGAFQRILAQLTALVGLEPEPERADVGTDGEAAEAPRQMAAGRIEPVSLLAVRETDPSLVLVGPGETVVSSGGGRSSLPTDDASETFVEADAQPTPALESVPCITAPVSTPSADVGAVDPPNEPARNRSLPVDELPERGRAPAQTPRSLVTDEFGRQPISQTGTAADEVVRQPAVLVTGAMSGSTPVAVAPVSLPRVAAGRPAASTPVPTAPVLGISVARVETHFAPRPLAPRPADTPRPPPGSSTQQPVGEMPDGELNLQGTDGGAEAVQPHNVRGAAMPAVSVGDGTIGRVGDGSPSPGDASVEPAAIASAAMRQVADTIIATVAKSGAVARPGPLHDAVAGGPARVLAVRMDVPELGEIDIRMALNGEALTLAIRVEHEDAARRLRIDREVITGILRAAGYDTDIAAIDIRHTEAGVGRIPAGTTDPSFGGALQQGASGQAGTDTNPGQPRSDTGEGGPFPAIDTGQDANEEPQHQDRRISGLYV